MRRKERRTLFFIVRGGRKRYSSRKEREKREERTAPTTVRPFSRDREHAGKAASQPRNMIREKRLFCKLIKIKKSAQQLYVEEKYLRTKREQVCPVCGRRGSWQAHGQYERSVIDCESGRVVYGRIKIKRVRCESCGHTHAIIPDYIIPYCTYSLLFVLRVLGEYFLKKRAVERICSHYNITPSMVYSWKGIFEEHKEIWLGVLAASEQTGGAFIRWLVGEANYSERFGEAFFKKTARSFLQSHRETARYRHAVF